MSTKKTIQINPELFKIPGNKSRKNRDKKELSLNPIIKPNNLKNKLLKRIKEHKTQEIKTKSNKPISSQSQSAASTNKSYTDEFYGALDYLSDLTKKKRVTESKQRDLNLNTKTLKNYINTNTTDYAISLELPIELQDTKSIIPQTNEVFNINYPVQDIVPYGCLKNGKKKTYREWKELTNPGKVDISDIVRPPTPPRKNVETFLEEHQQEQVITPVSSREERLEQIKHKLKKLQDQETQSKQQSIDEFKKLEKQLSTPLFESPLEDLKAFDTSTGNTISSSTSIEDMIIDRETKHENEKIKKYLKKTVKRTFTLGKSDKLRRVSVLIKDRQTRKNIINTQKELKKTNLTDVKKYLREHGIIKVGSTCPTDILRKTFESAALTGEVNNINKDTLLHNFLSGQ